MYPFCKVPRSALAQEVLGLPEATAAAYDNLMFGSDNHEPGRGGVQPTLMQVVSVAWFRLIALVQPGLSCRRVS
jgi:hypothetical protein